MVHRGRKPKSKTCSNVNNVTVKEIILPKLTSAQMKVANDNHRFKIIAAGRRTGKGLDINTEIPTPSGYKLMKHILPGDVVFDRVGRPCNVVAVSDINNIDCYKVTFSDDVSIIVDAEHNWLTYNRRERKNVSRAAKENWKISKPRPDVRTVLEIKDTLYTTTLSKPEINHAIPMCHPVEYGYKSLLISPYVLGAWLGDGTSASSEFTSNDYEIIDTIRTEGYQVTSRNKPFGYWIHNLNPELRKLDLLGNKHIPEEYLHSSVDQRMALLQGLMDTDGYCEKHQCGFTNTNVSIISGMIELLSSLGVKYQMHIKHPNCNGNPGKRAFVINFSTDLSVFRLKRKHDRHINTSRYFEYYRYIVAVEQVPSIPTKCIQVDSSDGTYLATKHYIVTHNSTLCIILAIKDAFEGKKTLWVAPVYRNTEGPWDTACTIVRQMPIQVDIKISDRVIKFPSGGFIAFRSADSADSIRGQKISSLIMDEAAYIGEDVFEQILRPAMMDEKSNGLFISTPKRENDWFHKLYKRGLDGKDPEYKSFHFTSYDNPYIDRKELDDIKETTPGIVWRQEYLAEFVGATGSRIKSEWLKYEDITSIDMLKDWKLAVGVDLAIGLKKENDYTAAVVMGRDKSGNLHIIDAARTRATFADQQKFIKAIANKWNVQLVAIEDVAYQRAAIQELSAKTGFVVRGIKRNTDKVAFFAPLESRYEHGQIIHAKTLPPYFEQELLSFAVGEHDDCVDACSVAFAALKDVQSMQTPALAPVCNERESPYVLHTNFGNGFILK